MGTTVAPWQLFFQQSNVVDKRITPRWIAYERTDTIVGAFVVVIGAAAIMITTATAFHGTALAGQFHDAQSVAQGLADHVGRDLGVIFAVVLLDASVIGASAVTLATSYAFGDVFGIRHSLHRSWRDAKLFYAVFTGVVVAAAGIVLIPSAPLGLITTAVQALAGTLLPEASLFLLLLCNDPAVLGPWVNSPWLNVLATLILATLVILSLILVVSTIFPDINITVLLIVCGGALVAGLAVIGLLTRGGERPQVTERSGRSGPSGGCHRSPCSPVRCPRAPGRIGMSAMAGYLGVAVLMLLVKAIELGVGH